MRYHVSVDTGGTFTDVVVADESGSLRIGKALTSRDRAYELIREDLAQILPELRLSDEALWHGQECSPTAGTPGRRTRSSRARPRGPPLHDRGLPDVLLLREGRQSTRSRTDPVPPPYIPRFLTFEIWGADRLRGRRLVPLDEDSARRDRGGAEARVEAVAVCLLWSTANPAHELASASCSRRTLARCPVHALAPAQPDRPRVPASVLDGDRRVAGSR